MTRTAINAQRARTDRRPWTTNRSRVIHLQSVRRDEPCSSASACERRACCRRRILRVAGIVRRGLQASRIPHLTASLASPIGALRQRLRCNRHGPGMTKRTHRNHVVRQRPCARARNGCGRCVWSTRSARRVAAQPFSAAAHGVSIPGVRSVGDSDLHGRTPCIGRISCHGARVVGAAPARCALTHSRIAS